MIRLFGIVFGGAAIRRGVLHADPVGRRIKKKSELGSEKGKLSKRFGFSEGPVIQ